VPEAQVAATQRYEIPSFAEEKVAPAVPIPAVPAESVPDAQNTGAEATPATPDAKPEEEVTPEQAAKRAGRRFERKLDRAYRDRAEAQARADLLEKRLTALEAPKTPEGEPTLDKYDYDPEKYATAKAEFAKTQAGKEIETKQRTEANQREYQRIVSGWEAKAERGADKYDDFHEKVGDLNLDSPVIASIMEAENGEDVAYYLVSNLKEAQRIAQLSPMAQVREIGKLEAKLLSTPDKPKSPSKAPAPITPLSGGATIATSEPSESDDYATWFKKRNKQVHGR
jgi:hypothetical protein